MPFAGCFHVLQVVEVVGQMAQGFCELMHQRGSGHLMQQVEVFGFVLEILEAKAGFGFDV